MSRRAANRRRPWDVSSLVLPALVLLAAVCGLALIAGSLGWFESGPGPRRGAPPGTLAVPAAAVTIPTYARVGLEHLIDRSSGDLRAVYLPEGSILPETMIDAKQIVGRVLSTDKAPGQVFSTQDFFPLGTREGIVAGIPPGKRALRIGAGKVNGIVGLGRGDRFDLVATFDLTRGAASVRVEGARVNPLGSQTQTVTVVEDGAVVQPLKERAIPGQVQKIVEEMVIAVAPIEVAGLTEALHSGARIDCVPRSGRPTDSDASTAAEKTSPRGGLKVVETISGGQRRVIAVPPGLSPVGAGPPGAGPGGG